jgi:catechol 2,3-dioxygenase-like lactoylglutathione lyase family enzyme
MSVKHIDHLNLSVRDLDETLAWYRQMFGFERREGGLCEDGTPWAILQAGDALLCVYEHPERTMVDGDELASRGLHGLNHFGLRITDRQAWERTVEREGVEVQYGGPVRWPRSTAWYVLDPTGYEIEVALWDGDEVQFPEPVGRSRSGTA